MKVLHVAPDQTLPAKILTESIAVIGRKRSGKSNDAAVIVEEALDLPIQTIILDPKGDWWGLTSSADGKHEGYPVVILGGQHSTIPDVGLAPAAGTATAKWVLETRYSIVVDLSQLEAHEIERFCSDFLSELRRAKIETPGSILLVVDEADELAPEDQRERVHVLKTMSRLIWMVKRGGAFGIATMFISQRVASLSKNILSQTEILIVLQTTGSQDLDAITEAIKHHVPGETKKERSAAVETLIREIVKLEKGAAVVVSGQMLKGIFHIPFRRRRTFDSGATPDLGESQRQPKVVAKVALAQLSDAMQRAVAEVKANDPATLKHDLADRTRELAAARKVIDEMEHRAPAIAKPEIKYVPMLEPDDKDHLGLIARVAPQMGEEASRAVDRLEKWVHDLGAVLTRVESAHSEEGPVANKTLLGKRTGPSSVRAGAAVESRPAGARQVRGIARPVRGDGERSSQTRIQVPAGAPPARTLSDGEGGLTNAESRMLRTFAELAAAGVRATRTSLGAWQGIRSDTGRFGSYLATLAQRGLIVAEDGGYVLTRVGITWAGAVDAPTPDALLARVSARLTPAERRVLEAVLAAGEITRSQLAETLGVKGDTGRFGSYISRLRDMGAIEYERSTAKIAGFLEGAAA